MKFNSRLVRKLSILGSLSLVSAVCFAGSFPERADEDNLTQEFAAFRSSQIKNVAYDLSFILEKGSGSYHGKATLHISLLKTDAPLSLDFTGKKIESIRVNGEKISDQVVRKGSFDIPAKHLKADNEVIVEYLNDFNQSPAGFYRSIDAEDKKEYLYTDFEPFQAHRLFPCVDQPDFKATYQVEVTAPAEWKVISNAVMSPVKGTPAKGQQVVHSEFKKPISTYLFFLGAGDYQKWTDHYGNLPIEIYARQSIAQYVDTKAIFNITKRGLKFYETYFHKPYPFPKYGNVYIPDFMFGGMENPGAITFNESYIFRGQFTKKQARNRANVILHEMAHMWFGDLVTMKWWNDLWLNESFATYLSMLCQADGLKDATTWNDFFDEKTWGYYQDTLVTTHPIEATVPDTRTSGDNFDGITYAKGASALQQLRYFVGAEAFKKGVQNYFEKYDGKNTTRADFIAEIASASHQNLEEWTKAWLQTAGPNAVQVEWSCAQNKIDHLIVHQAPNSSQALSPHRTRMAFYTSEGKALKRSSIQEVYFSGATTEEPVKNAKGSACPAFLNPNEGNEDYAIYSLDPISLETVKAKISQFPGSLNRLMVWESLSQMVRDGKLAPHTYIETALHALETESDDSVIESILGAKKSTLRNNYFRYLTVEQRKAIAPTFEKLILARLQKAPHKSNLQLGFFDFFISIARTAESQAVLISWLDGKAKVSGVVLDQDRRWNVLNALAHLNTSDIKKRLEAESKRDLTNRGKAQAYAVKVAIPHQAIKEDAWDDFFDPKNKLDDTTFRAINQFQDPNHPELSKPFAEKFFLAIAKLDLNNETSRDRLKRYFDHLYPSECSEDIRKLSQEEFKKFKNPSSTLKRAWLESDQWLERCIWARALK